MASASLRFTGVALIALPAGACGARSAYVGVPNDQRAGKAHNFQSNCNKSKA